MAARIVIALLLLTGSVSSQSTVDILSLELSPRSNGMGSVGITQLDAMSGSANPAALGFGTDRYGAVSVYPSAAWGVTGYGAVVSGDHFLAENYPRFRMGVSYQRLERGGAGGSIYTGSGRPDTQQNENGMVIGGTEFDINPYRVLGAQLDIVSLGVGYDRRVEIGVGGTWKRYRFVAGGSGYSAFDLGAALKIPIVRPQSDARSGHSWRTNLDMVAGLSFNNLGSNPLQDYYVSPRLQWLLAGNRLRKFGFGAEFKIARRQLNWVQITAGLEWKTLLREEIDTNQFYQDLQDREPLTTPLAGDQTTSHYGVELTLAESVSLRWGGIRAAYSPTPNYPGLAGSGTDPEVKTTYYSRTTYGFGLSTVGLRRLFGGQSAPRTDQSFGAFLLANLNLEFAYASGYMPVHDLWLGTDFYSISLTL